jgi:hypothetical protein
MNLIIFKLWYKTMLDACYLRNVALNVKQFVIKVAKCKQCSISTFIQNINCNNCIHYQKATEVTDSKYYCKFLRNKNITISGA